MEGSKKTKSKKKSQEDVKKEEASMKKVTAIEDIPLNESDAVRIVITKSKDNSLSMSVTADEQEPNLSLFEIIGVIETAKIDLLERNRPTQTQSEANNPEAELVEVTLSDYDMKLDADQGGQLESRGLSKGDTITMPKALARMRAQGMKNAGIELSKEEESLIL